MQDHTPLIFCIYEVPIHLEPTSFKKGTKPDGPPKNVDKPHLNDPISTKTNLDVTCRLDTSCDHLLNWDSPSHSSEPKDTTSVDSVEIECLPESEAGEHVLERSDTPTALVERDKLDLSSVAPPKGEMESSFSWTYPFKSHTSSTLCFGEPTLRKPNQVKLLCNPISSTFCDFTLGKLSQETEFHITKHTPLVHTGTPFSVPKSSSGTNRVSDCHSSLVTTSSSRWILDKPKIEVTKSLIHHIGKNGEHFYGENFIMNILSHGGTSSQTKTWAPIIHSTIM